MVKRVLLFGTHPLRPFLLEQFRQEGVAVLSHAAFEIPGENEPVPDELVILTSPGKSGEDTAALQFLMALAGRWKGSFAFRPLVHLLLQESASLRMYQLSDFPPLVNEVFEVWPFTMEETWADQLVVRFPGLIDNPYPALDRAPITAESRQRAHLVLAGFDSYAQSIAVRAAQCAHFPNYRGKDALPIRTRISIVTPDMAPQRDAFIARYRQLFENSYYRSVFPDKCTSSLHHPKYEGQREDFVDIEWEFIEGDLSHPTLAERLANWAEDPSRQLTMVLSKPNDAENTATALALPEAVYDRNIPVWVRLHLDVLSATAGQNPRFGNLIPFGMDDAGYDVRLPALRMSRFLHYFYAQGGKEAPTVFPPEEVEREWRKAGAFKMRLSNVASVMSMATKMHSIGHDAADFQTFYALTADETERLARTEHNRWCVERLLSGSRPCTDEERAAIREDIGLKKSYKKEREAHLDLCAYDELEVDEKGIDVRIYDRMLTACIPLIIESYMKEERG